MVHCSDFALGRGGEGGGGGGVIGTHLSFLIYTHADSLCNP